MKKLFLLLTILTAFACSNEPEVKPDYILVNGKLEKINYVDRIEMPPGSGDGCLSGSPSGYCCLWSGHSYQCVRIN